VEQSAVWSTLLCSSRHFAVADWICRSLVQIPAVPHSWRVITLSKLSIRNYSDQLSLSSIRVDKLVAKWVNSGACSLSCNKIQFRKLVYEDWRLRIAFGCLLLILSTTISHHVHQPSASWIHGEVPIYVGESSVYTHSFTCCSQLN